MVYGIYNYIVAGAYKPTYILGAWHCRYRQVDYPMAIGTYWNPKLLLSQCKGRATASSRLKASTTGGGVESFLYRKPIDVSCTLLYLYIPIPFMCLMITYWPSTWIVNVVSVMEIYFCQLIVMQRKHVLDTGSHVFFNTHMHGVM